MNNLVQTIEQAQKIQTAIVLGTPIAAPVVLTQLQESELIFKFFVNLNEQKALRLFKDLNIKVLGEKSYVFAGVTYKHMQFELRVQIEEDWELEEELVKIWGNRGYKTPTQIFKAAALK